MTSQPKIFVAGHRGMVDSAIVRALLSQGDAQLVTRTRAELDLLDQAAVRAFFAQEKPDQVYLAAAKVGGHPRQQHLSGRLHLRKPHGRVQHHRRSLPARGETAAVSGFKLHLPQGRPANHGRRGPSDRHAGAQQTALRHCQCGHQKLQASIWRKPRRCLPIRVATQ